MRSIPLPLEFAEVIRLLTTPDSDIGRLNINKQIPYIVLYLLR